MDFLILLVGFILLIKGADFFVDSASSIAKKFGVPSLLIGLTIVAFGTSAPEAAVSITAALKNQNNMAIANVVGSNMFNLLVVVGAIAIIKPIKVINSVLVKEFPFLILSSIILLILSFDTRLDLGSANALSRADGLILLAIFSIFMYYLIETALTSKDDNTDKADEDDFKNISVFKSIIGCILGAVAIVIGGQLTVNSASSIALSFGMSETLVGLTIVSVGTSLPELVTSLIAAKKGESDMAIGNVIGSNMFNILFVLASSSSISSISVSGDAIVDICIMVGAGILTYIFSLTKKSVNRVEGLFLVLTYATYLGYIIIR